MRRRKLDMTDGETRPPLTLVPLTEAQALRAKHPKKDARGFCKRCALHVTHNYGRCPAGFWMNAQETRAWERGLRFEKC
jgi:hypothetical protein